MNKMKVYALIYFKIKRETTTIIKLVNVQSTWELQV